MVTAHPRKSCFDISPAISRQSQKKSRPKGGFYPEKSINQRGGYDAGMPRALAAQWHYVAGHLTWPRLAFVIPIDPSIGNRLNVTARQPGLASGSQQLCKIAEHL